MSCELSSLPNLTFIALAVANEYEYMAVAAVQLVTQSSAGSGGHTLTQRTSRQINARSLGAVGMRREVGTRLVQGTGLFQRIEALQSQCCICTRACMSLGQNTPVTIFPTRVLRVNLHDIAIEDCHCVCDRHRAAYMSKAKRTDGLQGLNSNFGCEFTESLHLFCFLH